MHVGIDATVSFVSIRTFLVTDDEESCSNETFRYGSFFLYQGNPKPRNPTGRPILSVLSPSSLG